MRKKLDVRFLPIAEEDIAEILDYIALDNVSAASTFFDKLEKKFEYLSEYPQGGIKRTEKELSKAGYYSLVFGNYIIFYTFDSGILTVHRVLSSYRDYLKFF
jgi:toxin ParE1/3/4